MLSGTRRITNVARKFLEAHSSTSALIKHLKSHHRERHAEVQKLRKVDKIPRDQPTLHAAMSTETGSPIPSTSQSQGITSFETFSAFLRHLQPLNDTITHDRNRLKPENASKLIFMKHALKILNTSLFDLCYNSNFGPVLSDDEEEAERAQIEVVENDNPNATDDKETDVLLDSLRKLKMILPLMMMNPAENDPELSLLRPE